MFQPADLLSRCKRRPHVTRVRCQIERLEQRQLFAADLSSIIDYVSKDTNADGQIAPVDALRIINHLNATSATGEPMSSGELDAPSTLDVNQDQRVTPQDAINVINQLNREGTKTLDVERFWADETASMNDSQLEYTQIVFDRLNRLRETESITAQNVAELVDNWMPLIQESDVKPEDYDGPWLSQGYEVPISDQNPEQLPLDWTPFGRPGEQQEIGEKIVDLFRTGKPIYDAVTDGLTWTRGWTLAMRLFETEPTGVDAQGQNWDTYYTPSGGFTPAFFESGWGQVQDATGWDPYGKSGTQSVFYDDSVPRRT